MTSHSSFCPSNLPAAERIAEIGQILARGLIRLQARQSSRLSGPAGESLLDFLPAQSGAANDSFGEQHREW